MRASVFIVLASTLLAGCGLLALNVTSCPSVPKYAKSFQAQMATEIEKLPHGSAVEEALKDYAVLREQLRMCR